MQNLYFIGQTYTFLLFYITGSCPFLYCVFIVKKLNLNIPEWWERNNFVSSNNKYNERSVIICVVVEWCCCVVCIVHKTNRRLVLRPIPRMPYDTILWDKLHYRTQSYAHRSPLRKRTRIVFVIVIVMCDLCVQMDLVVAFLLLVLAARWLRKRPIKMILEYNISIIFTFDTVNQTHFQGFHFTVIEPFIYLWIFSLNRRARWLCCWWTNWLWWWWWRWCGWTWYCSYGRRSPVWEEKMTICVDHMFGDYFDQLLTQTSL